MHDSSRAIAYHEAGHVVASRHLGRSIAAVTIVPAGGRLGNVFPQLPAREATASVDESLESTADFCRAARALMPPYRSREPGAPFVLEALDRGVVLLCGPEAEKRASDVCIGGYLDIWEARMLANALAISPSSQKHYFRLFQREARALVGRFWCVITAVAEALHEKGTLTGDQVDLVAARWFAMVEAASNSRPSDTRHAPTERPSAPICLGQP